jgi:hypothetical protein
MFFAHLSLVVQFLLLIWSSYHFWILIFSLLCMVYFLPVYFSFNFTNSHIYLQKFGGLLIYFLIASGFFILLKNIFLFWIFFFFDAGVWTQDLHLEPLHQPCLCDGFFWDRVSLNYLPWLALNHNPPISASWVARITCVSQRHPTLTHILK